MKRFLLIIATAILPSMLMAQTLETKSDYSTGYVTGTYTPYFTTVDGVLYGSNDYSSGWILMKYPAGSTSTVYEVDSRCNRIARGAFEGASNLKVIYIPSSVKSIGENAFDGCTSLQGIVYGKSTSTYCPPVQEAESYTEKTEVARYTLDGRKCSASEKGVQIIVFSDYTSKTVLNE